MSVNKVILIGNLGKDPELRYTGNQNPVCSFSLATTDRRKDATSGEWVEYTEWHNIVVWGKTAENCAQYLAKGRKVYIEGRLQTRKWQDKEGRDRYTTEVVASTVEFLTPKGEGAPARQASSSSSVLSSIPTAEAIAASGPEQVSFQDDDIPF